LVIFEVNLLLLLSLYISSAAVLTVAESLLEKCEVTFSGCVMRIVKPPCDADSITSVQEPVSVYLTGIPAGTKEDILIMFLENKRKSGGGPIRSIDYSEVDGSAVVCFEDDTSKIHCLCFVYSFSYKRGRPRAMGHFLCPKGKNW